MLPTTSSSRIALAAVVLLATVSMACASLFGQHAQPAELWVRADRATHDVVAPRLTAYVEADAELSLLDREALLGLLADWGLRLREAEALYPPQVGPGGGFEDGGAR